jgi:hypothetical protein
MNGYTIPAPVGCDDDEAGFINDDDGDIGEVEVGSVNGGRIRSCRRLLKS